MKLIGQLLLFRKMPNIDCPVIYCITNLINGNEYIGASRHFKNRIHAHRSTLNCGSHNSQSLQSEYNQYGVDAFAVSILEYTDIENLYSKECEHIQKRKPAYNINSLAPSSIVPIRKVITPEERKELFLLRKAIWGMTERVAERLCITKTKIHSTLSPKARYMNRELVDLIRRELKIISNQHAA